MYFIHHAAQALMHGIYEASIHIKGFVAVTWRLSGLEYSIPH